MSLKTPPGVAHFKCSLISSATTDTRPQGEHNKQMEDRKGERRRREKQKRGKGISKSKGRTCEEGK